MRKVTAALRCIKWDLTRPWKILTMQNIFRFAHTYTDHQSKINELVPIAAQARLKTNISKSMYFNNRNSNSAKLLRTSINSAIWVAFSHGSDDLFQSN